MRDKNRKYYVAATSTSKHTNKTKSNHGRTDNENKPNNNKDNKIK